MHLKNQTLLEVHIFMAKMKKINRGTTGEEALEYGIFKVLRQGG